MKITRKQLRQLLNESLNLSFNPQATQEEKDQMKHTLSRLLNIPDIDMYDIEDVEWSVLPQKEEDPWVSDMSSNFTNELGNDIEIEIKDFGCGSANQLTISIIGPNSEAKIKSRYARAPALT